MKKNCIRCGAIFEGTRNRRYCDECDELRDPNLSTVLLECHQEELDNNGVFKSKKIGFCCLEKQSIYFHQTKHSNTLPIKLESSVVLNPIFDGFRKLLKSRKKLNKRNENKNNKLKTKNKGLILKDGKIYLKQVKNGTENLVEFHGAFFYPPNPKEYPVYKTGCTICKNVFLTFSNKTKYCSECKIYKRSKTNQKYKKKIKVLRRQTNEEIFELETQKGYVFKNYKLPKKLGTYQDKKILIQLRKKREEYI
jgi:hypothetical protein